MRRLSITTVALFVFVPCLVSPAVLAPASAQPAATSSTGSPAAPTTKLDPSRIKIEPWNVGQTEYASAPPLFVVGGWGRHDTLISEYHSIARGQPFPGTDMLCGRLGRGYPAAGRIVAERFERIGNEFCLEFRYVVSKEPPKEPPREQPRDDWTCHIAAPIPRDLPDGTYRITVEVHDLPREATLRPEQALETTFTKPDEPTKRRTAEVAALEKAPLAEWIDLYRAAAAAAPPQAVRSDYEREVIGEWVRNADWGRFAWVNDIKWRLIKRKHEASPHLLAALEVECRRNPEPERDEPPRGISHDLMKMLLEIGDARAAPLLVAILSGEKGANTFVRRAALDTLEELTHVRFRRRGSGIFHTPDDDRSVAASKLLALPTDGLSEMLGVRRTAEREQDAIAYRAFGERYAEWLAAHPTVGSDRGPWLKAAEQRSREWLASDDLELAFNAAHFLRSKPWRPHDEDPAATTDAIAALLERSTTPDGQWRKKPPGDFPSFDVGDWLRLLVASGLPERHVPLLLRFAPAASVDTWGYSVLDQVGGKELMTRRIESYRRHVAELTRQGMDPRKQFADDEKHPLQGLVYRAQETRYAIERWAGRIFADDAALEAWWAASKDGSQRLWIEDGLPLLAAQADAGEARAQNLLRIILDQLPNPPSHWTWLSPGIRSDPPPRPEDGPPFRVEWVRRNRVLLQYVPERGAFRLAKSEEKSK